MREFWRYGVWDEEDKKEGQRRGRIRCWAVGKDLSSGRQIFLSFSCSPGEVTKGKNPRIAHNLQGIKSFDSSFVCCGEGKVVFFRFCGRLTSSCPQNQLSIYFLQINFGLTWTGVDRCHKITCFQIREANVYSKSNYVPLSDIEMLGNIICSIC